MAGLPFSSPIDFIRACEAKTSFKGSLDADFCERLKQDAQPCSRVDLDFAFGFDLQGLATLKGTIACEVSLKCERCGKDFVKKLKADFCCSCDEKKARSLRLEDKIDLVQTASDGTFDLADFLEDCLLLELPYVPRHEAGDPQCVDSADYSCGEVVQDQSSNPFAKLSELYKECGSK